MTARIDVKTAILGAGPAGTGPLVCAIQKRSARALLDGGVAWIDRATHMGAGRIGDYDITSDTAASVLLECLRDQESGPLRELISAPIADEVRAFGTGPLPLPVCGRYLAALGEILERVVGESRASRFVPETTLDRIAIEAGRFHVHGTRAGEAIEVTSERLVFALGGAQKKDAILDAEIASGLELRGAYEDKTVLSSDLVTAAGQASVRERLKGRKNPRIVILGGSHSALTCAWIFLERSGVTWDDGAIAIVCRRKPKIFYPTLAAAREDGYLECSERDVCPVTGRVFRLAGLRLAARDLMRSISGLGGLPRERRVTLDTYAPALDANGLRARLDHADVIVPAFGYAPITLPLTIDGEPRRFLSETRYRAPLVDGGCRVLLDGGAILPSAFAMGLASGFVPHGPLGGEPSFDGQTNGLWLYQNGVGEIVLEQIMR